MTTNNHPHANKARTEATIRRIAELRIKALGLNITIDKYLRRCAQNKAA